MDYKEASNIVKAAVRAKTGKQLSEAEETVLRGAWEGKTYESMAETSGYTVNYLKNDAGPNFWKLLSEALGEKVSKANLRAVLERHSHYSWEQQQENIEQTRKQARAICQEKGVGSKECAAYCDALEEQRAAASRHSLQHRLDWGEAPPLPTFYGRTKEVAFYGRTQELDRLKQAILHDKDPLVVLLGIRGIGKTTLAVKLVEDIQGEFEYVIWRSLRSPSPKLTDLLADIIGFLSQQPKIDLPKNVDERLSLLMERLRQHRCLLILDNAESLMADEQFAGTYQEDYKEYGDLWRRIGTERHQSCLILTSRENTKQLVELSTQGFPIRLFPISGLATEDARKLLENKGLSDEPHLEDLIEIYQGNPLALQIVSTNIKQNLGGKVSDYLKEITIRTTQIFDLIDQQFHSSSDLERKIMRLLSRNRHPMSFDDLKTSLCDPEVSGAELLEAIESLRRRSLIRGENYFQLDRVLEVPDNEDIRQRLERAFESS
jgi:hypothetical protein